MASQVFWGRRLPSAFVVSLGDYSLSLASQSSCTVLFASPVFVYYYYLLPHRHIRAFLTTYLLLLRLRAVSCDTTGKSDRGTGTSTCGKLLLSVMGV